MADKTRSIKGATDKELDEIIARLRKENEVQSLIFELKRKGSKEYIPYDSPGVSTEESIESLYHANKTKSIKELTDKELNELIIRLRKENEAQSLVGELKRKSNTGDSLPYDRPEVSTEEPIESLYHYGILGMRWGIKKRRASAATKSKSRVVNKPDDVGGESEDHQKKVALRTKKVSEMSNDELQAFTKRMNLEKQYKDLTKTEVSAGRKFVTDVLTNSAKTIATKYVTEYGTKAVESLIKRAGKE